MSANVYVDDFARAVAFHRDVLDLERSGDMHSEGCFFVVAGKKWGIFLEGGHVRSEVDADSTRSAFTFDVPSAGALFTRLTEHGAATIHPEPQDMGNGTFWFMFRDPAGNILEAIGQR